MASIDFHTALGQLLSSAPLRDRFRRDPVETGQHLNIDVADRPALLELSPDQLEYQAESLLRKRLETVRPFVPICCSRLGNDLWTQFRIFSAEAPTSLFAWSQCPDPALQTALRFVLHLHRHRSSAVCQTELNRLRFALGQHKFRAHVMWDYGSGLRRIPALQLLFRWKSRRREYVIHFGRP